MIDKTRAGKVPERVKSLAKKYPYVTAAVVLVGVALGVLLMVLVGTLL